MIKFNRYNLADYKIAINKVVDKNNLEINYLFTSTILLIEWTIYGAKPRANISLPLVGELIIKRNTPLGKLRPIIKLIEINSARENYIELIDINDIPFGYEIELKQPSGVIRTQVKISENTQKRINMNTFDNQKTADLSSLTAAITNAADQAAQAAENALAQAAAQSALHLAAIGRIAGETADAIANNEFITDTINGIANIAAALIVPEDARTQVVTISNTSASLLRLWVGGVPPVNYSSGNHVVELNPGGGFTVEAPQCKTAIYIAGLVDVTPYQLIRTVTLDESGTPVLTD